MELTQRLEFTQQSNLYQLDKVCPEQIGFLGICGNKYPVKKGPNKIGRDPQTCSIVLNMNSISRQHAVLNILTDKEFMLMDLDSANKTKLIDKTLQPYIPHPIKNGDTVQFGHIFGIFRLLEEDTDLPMTQAIDVPDTPVVNRNLSKLNQVPITTIPESPDVSDKDDSFICPSQPQKGQFKSPNNRYIKTSGKTIAIQPVGSNKIDNVYWNSSKKSRSLNLSLNDSGTSLEDSIVAEKLAADDTNKISEPNIHEMETQVPYPSVVCQINSIYTAETQVPTHNPTSASIHTLETQVPNLSTENLPTICKISNQFEMQCDFFTSNKENDISIYNAETQVFPISKEQTSLSNLMSDDAKKESHEIQKESDERSKSKIDESDDVILFDEIDNHMFEDDFDSQPLLPPETLVNDRNKNISVIEDKQIKDEPIIVDGFDCAVSVTKNDSEDINIIATQKISKDTLDVEDLTDCEEDIFQNNNECGSKERHKSDLEDKTKNIDILPTQKLTEKINIEDDLTDCEDDLMQPNIILKGNNVISVKDAPTQIIKESVLAQYSTTNAEEIKEFDEEFEDMPTQIIENNEKELCFEELPTQIIDGNNTSCISDLAEVESPFKIPLQSPIRVKRKDISKLALSRTIGLKKSDNETKNDLDEDDQYYIATQEIIDDLCTQKIPFLEDVCYKNGDDLSTDDNIVPSSVENYKLGERFPHITNEMSPKKILTEKSHKTNESKQKINQYVPNTSTKEIKEVIVADIHVKPLNKMPSDPSDLEDTPKKVRSIKLMETELPNSQEIKTSVTLTSRNLVTESSSESETENNSEECTPILFKNRKKVKPKIKAAKIDLSKKFDTEILPTRIITRVRKPTAKVQNSEEAKNFLKPKFLREQNDVDNEIITENISRLKNKVEKGNGSKDSVNDDLKFIEQNVLKQKTRELKSDFRTKECSSKDKKLESHKKDNKESHKKDNKESHKKEQKISIKDENKMRKGSAEHKSRKNKSLPKADDGKLSNMEYQKSTGTTGKTSENVKIVRSSRSKSKKDKLDTELTSVEKPAKEKTIRKDTVKQTSKENNKKSNSPERNTMKIKNDTKKNILKETSPEVVQVRRSRRQRTVKDKADNSSQNLDDKPALKRSKKLNEEQSTIYSLSSESGVESPKNLKRSGTFNEDEPNSKRSRSVIGSNNTSLRSTPARVMRAPLVLFTAFTETVIREVTVKLEKLGAVVVTDVTTCSVLVTQQIKRTFKLLCAVGLGRPIVGPNWVQACHDTNIIVDPWLYLIKDDVAEKRFHFNLEKTLISKRNFLKGYNVSSTPNVVPKGSEMKLIVECSGGTWNEGGQNWICISTHTDKHLWPALKRRGATLVAAEFILGGVLRQQIDIQGNLLS